MIPIFCDIELQFQLIFSAFMFRYNGMARNMGIRSEGEMNANCRFNGS